MITEMIYREQADLDAAGPLFPAGRRLAQSSWAGTPDPESCSKGGKHSQQRVQCIFKLRCGDPMLYFSCHRLALLQGDQDPIVRGFEKQGDGRLRVSFVCGSELIDVSPPEEWDGEKPKAQRAVVELNRIRPYRW